MSVAFRGRWVRRAGVTEAWTCRVCGQLELGPAPGPQVDCPGMSCSAVEASFTTADVERIEWIPLVERPEVRAR